MNKRQKLACRVKLQQLSNQNRFFRFGCSVASHSSLGCRLCYSALIHRWVICSAANLAPVRWNFCSIYFFEQTVSWLNWKGWTNPISTQFSRFNINGLQCVVPLKRSGVFSWNHKCEELKTIVTQELDLINEEHALLRQMVKSTSNCCLAWTEAKGGHFEYTYFVILS